MASLLPRGTGEGAQHGRVGTGDDGRRGTEEEPGVELGGEQGGPCGVEHHGVVGAA